MLFDKIGLSAENPMTLPPVFARCTIRDHTLLLHPAKLTRLARSPTQWEAWRAFALQDLFLLAAVGPECGRQRPIRGFFEGGCAAPEPHCVSRVKLKGKRHRSRFSHRESRSPRSIILQTAVDRAPSARHSFEHCVGCVLAG